MDLLITKIKRKSVIFSVCLISFFIIIILVKDYNTRKHIKRMQSSIQNLYQSQSSAQEILAQEIKTLTGTIINYQKELNDKLDNINQSQSSAQEILAQEIKTLTGKIISQQEELSDYLRRAQSNISGTPSNPQELSAIQNSQQQLQTSIDAIKINSEALLRNAMAEKVEMIVKNKTTTEEKVIAIARWVSSNIANNNYFGPNTYTWFSDRSALCTMRAVIFVKMLKYINVYAQLYNICKFPVWGSVHSGSRVYYDNSWHFFDVTYAGYFKKDNKILSFEEIVDISKEEDPLKYLIVLEETLDVYRSLDTTSLYTLPEDKAIQAIQANNLTRMREAYSRNNMQDVAGYGPSDSMICSK